MSQSINPQDWENICNRCGACCFEKKLDSYGNLITTTVPCRFLDILTRECRIYHQRLNAEEDCIKLTPDNLSQLDWLPEACAYRKRLVDSG